MFFPYNVETDLEYQFSQERPYLVWVLLLAMVGVFVQINLRLPPEEVHDIFYRFGVVKIDLTWYSFVTCTFLHGGWIHLLGNAFFLWIYGSTLEKLFGSLRFLGIYLFGAVLSMLIHLLTLSPFMRDVPAIGASGAISAILGAFFVIMPTARIRCVFLFLTRPILCTMPAFVILGLWFLNQLFFSMGQSQSANSVAFWAHVAGFGAGALIAPLFFAQKQKQDQKLDSALQTHLEIAWEAYTQNRNSAAREALLQVAELTVSGAELGRGGELIDTVLSAHPSIYEGTQEESLQKHFQSAINRVESCEAVTIYLLMLRIQTPETIAPDTHRLAGIAAASTGNPYMALLAFMHYCHSAETTHLPQVLERAELILRNRLQRDDLADKVTELKQTTT